MQTVVDSPVDDNVHPQHGMAFAGKCAFYKNYVEFDLHAIGKRYKQFILSNENRVIAVAIVFCQIVPATD